MILSTLRHQIIDGHWLPGQQIAPRRELELSFGVSPTTLQRAMDHLIRDGFLSPVTGVGTFVAERLPFLSHYGLVFPHPTSTQPWNRFWVALKNEAERIDQSGGRNVPVYYGDEGRADAKEYQRLLRHIRDHRLAGLIFVSPSSIYRGTPLLDTPGLPRVAISRVADEAVPRIGTQSLAEKALDYLLSRDRRRVALVTSSRMTVDAGVMQPWLEGVAKRRMIMHPCWVNGLDIDIPQTAQSQVHLLMRDGQAERPDALVIGDDNLVEYATAGLIDAGVKVPEDVEVVAHCNFPWPTPSVLPVKRLGYDARECLRACIDAIDQQRQGKPVPSLIEVPARFEEEIVTAGRPAGS